MKALNLTLAALLLTLAQAASAGVQKFNSSEFNDIISDSLKEENSLRTQLRANAGMPNLRKELDSQFEKKERRVVGIIEGESRVSPTTNFATGPGQRAKKKSDRGDLQRLANELSSSEMD